MDLYDKYKKDIAFKDMERRDRIRRDMERDFSEIVASSANSHRIQYFTADDIPYKHFNNDDVIIDDGGSYVEKTSDDSKKVLCGLNSGIKVGTYILWNNMNWLVISQDIVTNGAYKKYGIKPCYVVISKRYEDRIIDFPVVYNPNGTSFKSTGLNATSPQVILDVTMQGLIIPNDVVVRDIVALNNRVMVSGEKVFRIKKEEAFASLGVVHLTMEQEVFTDVDNREDNIADDVIEQETEKPQYNIEITGDGIIKIGSRKEYVVNIIEEVDENIDEDFQRTFILKIDSEEDIDTLLEDIVIDDKTIRLKAKKDVKNINKIFKIVSLMKIGDASVDNEENIIAYAEKDIIIKGLI